MTPLLNQINSAPCGLMDVSFIGNLPFSEEDKKITTEIKGQLYISSSGYVYAEASKAVIWVKFLGLAIHLPLRSCIEKCKEIFNTFMGAELLKQGYHDLDHTFKLAEIAWKALTGPFDNTLFERVEEFALTELKYNQSRRDKQDLEANTQLETNEGETNCSTESTTEIDTPRSQRFKEGFYTAPCMQPLFHKNQISPSLPLRRTIGLLTEIQTNLKKSIIYKQQNCVKNFVNSLIDPESVIPSDPYKELTKNEIEKKLLRIEGTLKTWNSQLELSNRCHKYVFKAIWNQQTYTQQTQLSLKDNEFFYPQTQLEGECCGQPYKHQRMCGILHKVDCCTTAFWAIDLGCCVCCVWPDSRQACCIT